MAHHPDGDDTPVRDLPFFHDINVMILVLQNSSTRRKPKSHIFRPSVGDNTGADKWAGFVPKDMSRKVLTSRRRTSKIQILIASINTLAFMVNLHNCCSDGLFICLASSAATMRQITSRLIRLNQTQPVSWYIIRLINSCHDYQERSLTGKWVRQIAAECRMPPNLPLLFQEVLIYEAIKSMWCQSFNRFAWMLLLEQN
ncbi:unnamed protein product [Clonostachys byssicola]|uniref:Uncharacterized protein n=1 Tax=Clonostachys byssicola TaxID=160290 RepID=A0A9N9UCJ0_9HYPO|nr:unnamed protein product [Clonostachys byssicola]